MTDSAPQEQVELGRLLMKLKNQIPGFVARIVPGQIEPGQWTTLAEVLETLAAECRSVEPSIIVDSESSHRRPADDLPPVPWARFSASGP